jgi:DNA-binding response OmpR family regulator
MSESTNPPILVADDDENLRASVRAALERDGFRVG